MKNRYFVLLVTLLLPWFCAQCGGDDSTALTEMNASPASTDPAGMSTATADPSSTGTAPPEPIPTSTVPPATTTTTPAPTSNLPPAPPCMPPAVVCEDFEAGAIHTDVWGVRAPNGSIEVVSDRVAHGKYAMKAHTVASAQSQAQLVSDKFLGANFYGRMYVYFEKASRNQHAALFEGLGNDMGNSYSMSVSMGRQMLFIGYQRNNPFLDLGTNSRVSFPVGKWACLEWNFRPVEGVNNTLWLDGVQIAAFHAGDKFSNGTTGMFVVPAFTEARIGWSHVAHDDPDPTTDIWFDDVAFGPERIGCLPTAVP